MLRLVLMLLAVMALVACTDPTPPTPEDMASPAAATAPPVLAAPDLPAHSPSDTLQSDHPTEIRGGQPSTGVDLRPPPDDD